MKAESKLRGLERDIASANNGLKNILRREAIKQMSENKRYYWLKLKEDFFDDDTIRYIEEQENGIKYSNFYLKLCLKSLRTDGRLVRFVGEMLIPYDIKSLSALTGVDADTVRCAMALFERIGCVKVLESGELYISQLAELVGSETDKAKLMRISRAREKASELSGVTMLPECYPEIDIEKDIDIEKEKDNKRSAQNKRFVPPSVDEVRAYCKERGNNIDAESFVDYYTSTGWLVGKKPMKDWKASVRTWERNERRQDNARPDTAATGNTKREWHLECAVDGTKDCNREPATGQFDWSGLS